MPRRAPDILESQRLTPENVNNYLGRQIKFRNKNKEWQIAKIIGVTEAGISISGHEYKKSLKLKKGRAIYVLPLID
jgi:hypothetical protein